MDIKTEFEEFIKRVTYQVDGELDDNGGYRRVAVVGVSNLLAFIDNLSKDYVMAPMSPTLCQNASCKHKNTPTGNEQWCDGLLVCDYCFQEMENKTIKASESTSQPSEERELW